MYKSLSFHVEQCNGLNHLAWCVWEHNSYNLRWKPCILQSANKISQSDAVLPILIKAIEREHPRDVIYLDECPRAKAYYSQLGHVHCDWAGLYKRAMDETLLAQGKDLISQSFFEIPDDLLFTPDLLFDDGFEGCILQDDATHHDDTTLFLSKAAAIGAICIADIAGAFIEG